MTTTFSSAQMRERDKQLEEKHQKEIVAVERKLERLKRSLNDADREIFDLRNRSNQLAHALGFSDIGEAQRAIDVSDHEVNFKQAFERVQFLEKEVKAERSRTEQSNVHAQQLKEELRRFKEHSSSTEKNERRLQQELRDLQAQFDSLKEDAKKVAQQYRNDRKRFRDAHYWMFVEPLETKGKQTQILDSKAEEKRLLHRRRELLRELGSGLMKLCDVNRVTLERVILGTNDSTSAQVTGSLSGTCRREGVNSSDPCGDTHEQPLPIQPLGSHCTSDPLQHHSARHPPTLLPITNTVKTEPDETPKQLKIQKALKLANSSDTEEDSQGRPLVLAVDLPSSIIPAPTQNLMARLVHHAPLTRLPGNSSDTEEDSQAPYPGSSPPLPPESLPSSAIKPIPERFMRPDLPARPSFAHTSYKASAGTSGTGFRFKAEPEDDTDALQDEHIAKRPRTDLDSFFRTPEHPKSNFSPRRRVFSTGQLTRGKKCYEDENTPINKPGTVVRTSGMTRLEDYTAYKGRGRYAKDKEMTKTINSLFTINAERNGGLNHQFQEVVRDREERQRMSGGDCECCHDYYAAVGPLPLRDQGPLWRSPSTAPVKACKRHGAQRGSSVQNQDDSAFMQSNIEAHKKMISRHRHTWARAQTPPGYWNIGFPDTPEAQRINERAAEMHQRKLREVEREAAGQGRWLRR